MTKKRIEPIRRLDRWNDKKVWLIKHYPDGHYAINQEIAGYVKNSSYVRVSLKFIKEIFEGRSPDEFDDETLTTINKFFENSLNVSETSRQLYIHRNTLVYRLDKLQKSTNLDLRVFEDAITFKIALMVVKYMKYMESLEY